MRTARPMAVAGLLIACLPVGARPPGAQTGPRPARQVALTFDERPDARLRR